MMGFKEFDDRSAKRTGLGQRSEADLLTDMGASEAATLLEAAGITALARPAALLIFGRMLRANNDIGRDKASTANDKRLSAQTVSLASMLLVVLGAISGDQRATNTRNRSNT